MKETKKNYTLNVKKQQDDTGNHHYIYQVYVSHSFPRKKILVEKFEGINK